MKNKTNERGDAYIAIRHIYDKSPGRSWRRLNGALQSALDAAIIGHLSFEVDDFAAIARDMNGGYWMGNGSGELGDRYYGLAVKIGHTPACISFERYAGRPAALWSEKVKTPERLCIGSDFTWKGQRLTVTNMLKDYFVACSYGERADEPHVYLDGYRRIDHQAAVADGCVALRLSAPMKEPSRKPEKVVKIPYRELATVRKEADALRKQTLSRIAAVESIAALADLTQELLNVPRGTFRHFDIEDIRKSLQDRESELGKSEAEAEHLQRWLAGGRLSRTFSQVRLRISGDYVETSTGQSASLDAVRRALPVVLKHRGKEISPSGLVVDIHTVTRISQAGVKVGCTLVPWAEVEKLAVQIEEVA